MVALAHGVSCPALGWVRSPEVQGQSVFGSTAVSFPILAKHRGLCFLLYPLCPCSGSAGVEGEATTVKCGHRARRWLSPPLLPILILEGIMTSLFCFPVASLSQAWKYQQDGLGASLTESPCPPGLTYNLRAGCFDVSMPIQPQQGS